jgi:hypothetical protein
VSSSHRLAALKSDRIFTKWFHPSTPYNY